jgi:hypothetical protein
MTNHLFKFSFSLLIALVFLVLGVELMAWAQAPSASPGSVAAVVQAAAPSSGLLGWIALHGGFMAVVMSCSIFMNSILSGLRTFLFYIDGIAPGGVIPPNYTGLTKLNIVAVWVGKVMDWAMSNVQH